MLIEIFFIISNFFIFMYKILEKVVFNLRLPWWGLKKIMIYIHFYFIYIYYKKKL